MCSMQEKTAELPESTRDPRDMQEGLLTCGEFLYSLYVPPQPFFYLFIFSQGNSMQRSKLP